MDRNLDPLQPRRPMSHKPFASELASLPADLAAELEDHLMESLEAGLRSGLSSEEARKSALRSLGAPSHIAHQCLKASDPQQPHRRPVSPQERVAILGWLLLGIGFASRVCAASDPSHGSIAACVALSVGSCAMALFIRRGRLPLRVGIGLHGLPASGLASVDPRLPGTHPGHSRDIGRVWRTFGWRFNSHPSSVDQVGLNPNLPEAPSA